MFIHSTVYPESKKRKSNEERISVALISTASVIAFSAIFGVVFYYAMRQFRKKEVGRKFSLKVTASNCSKLYSTSYGKYNWWWLNFAGKSFLSSCSIIRMETNKLYGMHLGKRAETNEESIQMNSNVMYGFSSKTEKWRFYL